MLCQVRTQFVRAVSAPLLSQLLDELLEHKVITHAEMESFQCTRQRSDKARDLIDMVRKKGNEASSRLITALCKHDAFLSEELELF